MSDKLHGTRNDKFYTPPSPIRISFLKFNCRVFWFFGFFFKNKTLTKNDEKLNYFV